MENNELYHYGIPGMRWGVRRYQRKDGTLTPRGQKRYNQAVAKLKEDEKVIRNKERTKASIEKLEAKRRALDEREKVLNGTAPKSEKKTKDNDSPKKSAKKMTDDELTTAVRRSEMEKRYRELQLENMSTGKKTIRDVTLHAVTEAGKSLAKDFLIKKGKQWLHLNADEEDVQAVAKKLKAEWDVINYGDKIKQAKEKAAKKEKIKDESNSETTKQKSGIKDESNESFSKKKSNDTEWYSGTVSGEGTSRRSSKGSKWANDKVVDAEWWDVPTTSASSRERAQLGESYVAGLLPEKRKRN